LRGENARFQLGRMESTGRRENIQISRETADLLVKAGKMHWLSARENVGEA
jgi:hypothetical protein